MNEERNELNRVTGSAHPEWWQDGWKRLHDKEVEKAFIKTCKIAHRHNRMKQQNTAVSREVRHEPN